MRLTRIHVAGFKSFVDPTDLKLPSPLVGIVGPNGCGKSNTIDAVRWVMGESSARHLRGESMDDVIFSGSSARKPVGKASVELFFDNSDGSLGGEYAAYAEIAIRREVTRDGQSKYFLNSARCRRRDIRDIFLGTGLGPRSYAIIEQGMISRLIDAKPEDMRVYLEEAAGISKYKERRRETENRIRHTRDNLDRLNDLIEEVDKQLAHLRRQASTAERYKTLKAEERQKRGELLVLRRRDFESRHGRQAVAIAEREKELAAAVAEQRAAEAAIAQAREQQNLQSERFNTVQAEFYRVGGEVARIEQNIEHTRQNRNRQNEELAEVHRQLEEARRQLEEDATRIAEMTRTIEADMPAFERLKESQRHSAEHLVSAENALAQWQGEFESFNRRYTEAQQTAEIERSRIEQLERSVAGAAARQEKLEAELGGIDLMLLTAMIEETVAEELAADEEEQRLQGSLARLREKQQGDRERLRERAERADVVKARLQQALGRLASLEALQQAALEGDAQAAEAWLQRHELEAAKRLAETLDVDTGWERAVELALGTSLDAVCIDDPARVERLVDDLPAARITLLSGGGNSSAPGADGKSDSTAVAAPPLSHYVRGPAVLDELLAGIHAADTVAEALRMRRELSGKQSVVTRDGLWFGPNWLRVARVEAGDSVLERGIEIQELKTEIHALETEASELASVLTELRQQLEEQETRRETVQHSVNDAVRALAAVKSTLAGHRQREQQQAERQRALQAELAELCESRARERENLEASKLERSEALATLDAMATDREQHLAEQQRLRTTLAAAREQRDADRDAGQELAIRVESLKSTRAATEEQLERVRSRIGELERRQQRLDAEMLADGDADPLIALEAALQTQLAAKLAGEAALGDSRRELEAVEARLRDHEQARQRHDSRALQLRDAVQNARMESQEVVVRLKTLDEQLAEHDYVVADIERVLDALDEPADLSVWSETLETLERRLQRLGNINLAAIDELAEQSERKTYLDEQHADVSEALATLERAIEKIDKETRQRFRDTFDLVNGKVQEFFPRLFGGGKGRLVMTGDDLLSTGVEIVAQPPGKRISNIQLLSGGEKALTAVAMVFAFFELNPSPFCMLDEVDAPLDDANVGRFCALVREMSERVQFIFITHNKVTMEMAQQLMGVTMHEPGVSRLVAVDVQEAVELAGA
ncbi:MAG: chromosome segregation protein SMC [Gammaproteobacteria bacterium]|nr:MAG: chromosome segregation protein SMC [Gammaproteobacteria bacterium]